jgi:hypothetical protein
MINVADDNSHGELLDYFCSFNTTGVKDNQPKGKIIVKELKEFGHTYVIKDVRKMDILA